MSTVCPPFPIKSVYSEILRPQFSRSGNKYPDMILFNLKKKYVMKFDYFSQKCFGSKNILDSATREKFISISVDFLTLHSWEHHKINTHTPKNQGMSCQWKVTISDQWCWFSNEYVFSTHKEKSFIVLIMHGKHVLNNILNQCFNWSTHKGSVSYMTQWLMIPIWIF